MNPLRPLAVATVALLCSGTALAQAPQMYRAGPGPDELWDVTVRMEMVGMPMQMPATTKFGRAKVLMPSPPKLGPSSENSAVFWLIGSNRPSAGSQSCVVGVRMDRRVWLVADTTATDPSPNVVVPIDPGSARRSSDGSEFAVANPTPATSIHSTPAR